VVLPSDSTKVTVVSIRLSPAAVLRCSGRTPSVTLSPARAPAASTAQRISAPLPSLTSACAACASTISAARKFIFGEPMKPATKRLSGFS